MQPENGQNLWQQKQEGLGQTNPQSEVPQAATQSSSLGQNSVSWEASESISHERDGTWFVSFAAIFTVLIGLSIWLGQWTFTILLSIMAPALLIYIKRPPKVTRYSLDSSGLTIDEQSRDFSNFRSFGILQEGGVFSIVLTPTKRFGQSLTIYFAESDGEKIVDILGAHLPMEELHLDFLDILLRRLRL